MITNSETRKEKLTQLLKNMKNKTKHGKSNQYK